MDITTLQTAMDEAVRHGVFPGGVLLTAVGEDTRIVCSGSLGLGDDHAPAAPETIYDLASLTKILCTTTLCMILTGQGILNPESRLVDLWPERWPEDKAELTVAHVLNHSGGFPAWRPVYRSIQTLAASERRLAAARIVLDEPLESRPGERVVYSDLGFILLGVVLERLTGQGLDAMFPRLIAGPLGLRSTGFRPLEHGHPMECIAPTENGPRRSGPPDGPWGEPRGGVPRGRAHDDNAAACGGVSGHAGLFGTAPDIWKIFNDLRRSYRDENGAVLAPTETVRRFWQPVRGPSGPVRALGFDMPSASGSSAGTAFSRNSVGHTGYTGTSLWHDPERDLTVILLSNRVHPSAGNLKITGFRPLIHDLAVSLAIAGGDG